MKRLSILVCLLISSFSSVVSQNCSYIWEYSYFLDEGHETLINIIEDFALDSTSIYFIGLYTGDTLPLEDSGFEASYFAMTEVDRNTCALKRRELYPVGVRIFNGNIFFQNKKYIFHFTSDDNPNSFSPNDQDWRAWLYRPSSLYKIDKDAPMNYDRFFLEKDGYHFSLTPILHGACFLEDHQLIFSYADIIHESKVDTLLQNPEEGFQYVKPGWFLVDLEGNVVDYDTLSEKEQYFVGHYAHYEQEEQKIYGLGGQLLPDRFPSAYDNNGLLSIFDLSTREFESIQRWNDTSDTLMRATGIYWDDGEFLVDGTRSWNVVYTSEDSFHLHTSLALAAGVASFDGESHFREYQDLVDYEVGYNDIFYEDSDSSFLMGRIVTSTWETNGDVDKEHFWIVRMHKQGYPLDTLRVKHGIPELDLQTFLRTKLDTSTGELFIFGSYNKGLTAPILPYNRFPILIKIQLQELLDMITSVEESPIANENVKAELRVYPTVFEENINLYNMGNASRKVKFNLYNSNGQLVRQEQVTLVHHEFATMSGFSMLTSGAYFYQLLIDDEVYTGTLIKQ